MNQEDIQKAFEAISKCAIAVAGDLVIEKHVDYEVNNVEAGGIGIQVINGEVHETSEIHEEEVGKHLHAAEDKVQESFGRQEQMKADDGKPREGLKEFLTEDWLEELRSDGRYTVGWVSAFVDALISSQYGNGIALDWAVEGREKRNAIMGYVLGLLVDAGVLKGSYNAIAERVDLMEKPRTFAKYMGEGKKQPFALWVKEYVSDNVGK